MNAKEAKAIAREGAIAHCVYILCFVGSCIFQYFLFNNSVMQETLADTTLTEGGLLDPGGRILGYIIVAGTPFVILGAILLRKRLRFAPPRRRGTLPMIWIPGNMLVYWGVVGSISFGILLETWTLILPALLLVILLAMFPFPKKTIATISAANLA